MCRLQPELSFKENEVMHLARSQRNLTEDASPAFKRQKRGQVRFYLSSDDYRA